MKEVIFAGFGGQGVLTASLILATAVMETGVNVSWMPSYGPAMRGGTANACVKYGDTIEERIGSPLIANADIAVIMNEPSLTFLHQCKPQATVFINSNTIPDTAEAPSEMRVYRINSDQIAADHQNSKGTSLVMLGAVIEACELASVDKVADVMEDMFAKKGKNSFRKQNRDAFMAGAEVIRNGR